jgi:metallophosphoesterase superfamily enzyme
MQIEISEGVVLDSRRATLIPRQDTMVISDLFLGIGAIRRKKAESVFSSQYNEILERLFGLLNEFQPRRIIILGSVKPNQGSLEDVVEQDELRTFFYKLKKHSKEVIQVVNNTERAYGSYLSDIAIRFVNSYRIGNNTLIHRRRTFVYPKHDPFSGFWINGGLHPIFTLPIVGNDGNKEYIRCPSFLHTGFALVMPPFVPYAYGWEVMHPERLPKQAKAWRLVGDHYIAAISISDLVTVNNSETPLGHLSHS